MIMKGIRYERIIPSKGGVSGTRSRSFKEIGSGINW